MIHLAVIGTAMRDQSEQNVLSSYHLTWMADNIKCYIEHVIETTTDDIILVSGGSAWSDPVAV